MASRLNYRTQDGQVDYKFSFEWSAWRGDWRAYIDRQPSYQGRPESAHATHRLTDWRGRRYVCWTAPLRTLDEAKHVAALWADATQDYIRYGASF